MRGMMKHFGHKGLVLGAVLCVLAWAGNAQAAGYEVRLPVEKSVRLAPPPETAPAESAKPEKPEKSEKSAKPEKKAEPAPAAAKADLPKPEARKPEVHKAEASKAKPAPLAVAKPEPKAEPAPAPKPAPKPKPEPKIDPLALQMPPAPAPHEPLALPEVGQFAGDLELEFQSDRILLRAATNGPVERVTTFGVPAPRKLAVDLRGPWRKKGGSVLRYDTGPVKSIVVGEHPDRLRLSVEFREGAVAPDMQPKVEIGQTGVTVTIPLAVQLKR
jgi:hypothetical protein